MRRTLAGEREKLGGTYGDGASGQPVGASAPTDDIDGFFVRLASDELSSPSGRQHLVRRQSHLPLALGGASQGGIGLRFPNVPARQIRGS
jgi:hypothetical protein